MKKVLRLLVVVAVFRCESYEGAKEQPKELQDTQEIRDDEIESLLKGSGHKRKRKPRDRDWEISYSC